jgi:hypothetical protein
LSDSSCGANHQGSSIIIISVIVFSQGYPRVDTTHLCMSRFQRAGTARLTVVIPDSRKHEPLEYEQSASPGNTGNLSPDLQPATPPTYPIPSPPSLLEHGETIPQAYKIGNYILSQQIDSVGDIRVYRAFHCDTRDEYVCKVSNHAFCLIGFIIAFCLCY